MKKLERKFHSWLLQRAGKMIGRPQVNENHQSTEIMRIILGGAFFDGVVAGMGLALLFSIFIFGVFKIIL